jgi:hypothetical protein
MPVVGTPPRYRRGTSFTDHSAHMPTVPQRGDRLDAEFDDIAFVLDQRAEELGQLVDAQGRLRSGSVGLDQLSPGLFDHITHQAVGVVAPLAEAAGQSAVYAARMLADAIAVGEGVQRAAELALGSADAASSALMVIERTWADFEQAARSVDEDEALAQNAADTAEGFMVQAEAARDLSEMWAEYLAGPVQPAPPGWPEAIDDGMWSAKWWAVRASEIVGTWGNWYLGAFDTAPLVPSTGPWPPGTLYYDTTLGQMFVWTGTQWAPMHTPGVTVLSSFVYMATAGQTSFSGADIHGRLPALDSASPEPTNVYVNGVRLVRSEPDGQPGDYVVSPSPFTLVIGAPLTADSVVQIDVLVSPAKVAPGAALVYPVVDIVFDGVTTTFALNYVSPDDGSTKPVTAAWASQLLIHLDGTAQKVGTDYTLNASGQLVFTQAPPAGTAFNAVWFVPGGSIGQVTAQRILAREWNLDLSIVAGPGSGKARFNNTTQAAATLLWVANVSFDGVDTRNVLDSIKTGADIYLQTTSDSSKWLRFVATGAAIDRTTYVEIPIAFTSGSGVLALNRTILMVYQ